MHGTAVSLSCQDGPRKDHVLVHVDHHRLVLCGDHRPPQFALLLRMIRSRVPKSRKPDDRAVSMDAPLTKDVPSSITTYSAAGAGTGAGAGAGAGTPSVVPTDMQAAFYVRTGDISVVQIGRLPVPALRDDQVLIRVHAAALNPVDYKARSGGPASLVFGSPSRARPIIVGFDVAGVIASVGSNCGRWSVGDEVFAMSDSMGACAVRGAWCMGCAAHHSTVCCVS